jgi:hypothetical protein
MFEDSFYEGSLRSLGFTAQEKKDMQKEHVSEVELEQVTIEEQLSSMFDNDVFGRVLAKCADTMILKGQDYTIGNADRLYNFKKVAELTGLSTRQVWSVYACKHLFAILNYVKTEGKSESEPIEGRIVDAINYLLFLSLIEERARHSLGEDK